MHDERFNNLSQEQLEILKRVADGEDYDIEELTFINMSNAEQVADYLQYECETIDLAFEFIKGQ